MSRATEALSPHQHAVLEGLSRPGMELHGSEWHGADQYRLPPRVNAATLRVLKARGLVQQTGAAQSRTLWRATGARDERHVRVPVWQITEAGRAALEGEP